MGPGSRERAAARRRGRDLGAATSGAGSGTEFGNAQPVPEPDPDKVADAADARSLLEIVQRRFGSRLDAEQLESIRDDLEGNMRAARALRALPLGNADEPDVVFRALIREAR